MVVKTKKAIYVFYNPPDITELTNGRNTFLSS